MIQQLSQSQKDLLGKAVMTPGYQPSGDEKSDWKVLEDKGLIWHQDSKTVTDRGTAFAIVHCNKSFNEICTVKRTLWSYSTMDREMFGRIFDKAEMDQVMYAKFKVMLDFDMFTANNAFEDPRGDAGYKMTNQVFFELAKNTTLPVPKLLKMMRIPGLGENGVITTREQLVSVLEQAKKAAGY